jgi:hypothetical protein
LRCKDGSRYRSGEGSISNNCDALAVNEMVILPVFSAEQCHS